MSRPTPNEYEDWIIRLFGCVKKRQEFHDILNHILILFPNDGKISEEEKKAVLHMFLDIEGEGRRKRFERKARKPEAPSLQ
jgi:hypothetical protein